MDTDSANKLPVTVVVPVKNEEKSLARCLERLNLFSEVIIVDSGSSDRTLQIAEAFGARIIDFQWNGKYPKKRNWFLLNEAPTNPWILFLDADELVDSAFCNIVSKAVENDDVNGYWLTYRNYFMGRRLRFGLVQRKLALFRFGKGLYERIEEDNWSQLDMEVHEHPIIDGKVGKLNSKIDHKDYKGLNNFIEKHMEYARWEARRYEKLQEDSAARKNFTERQKFKYKFISMWWYPWFYFAFTFFVKGGFLDGSIGFHHAAYKAWYFQTIRLLIRENSRESEVIVLEESR